MNSQDEALLRAILPDVSRETFDRLQAFEQMFRKWSSKINLAAPSALEDLWSRHILDSAQLVNLQKPEGIWLDLGSGGGFPGLIIAILMRDQPGAYIHLVESVGKKAVFLKVALMEVGGRGEVHNMRINEAVAGIVDVKIVTARALAPLRDLLALASPWLSRGALGLFHKGREFKEELALARDDWTFDLIEHVSKVDAESVILEISNVSHRI